MSAELGYDTDRLYALREEVRRLNTAALASGLFEARDLPRRADRKPAEAASPASQAAPKSKAARNRGKGAAERFIAMTGRIEGDESADVPGTRFTEEGVVRLLARLRRRRKDRTGPWSRFLTRAYRALSRPVPMGRHTIAGVSLARLQIFSGQLEQIEVKGIAFLEARRVARRGRLSQTNTLMLGGRLPKAAEIDDGGAAP